MNSSERYYYMKMNGLCVSCGEVAQKGRTRCIRCAQIDAVKEAWRRENMSEERKAERREYCKEYVRKHPEKNKEYQRRYRENEKRRCEW